MKKIAVLCGLTLFVTAQTPTPAPIRHLEYRISEHSTRTATAESYDGMASGMQTRGLQGTMNVDVLAIANDGGMVVRAQVTVDGRGHSDQPVTCAVYGNGEVVCPPDAPISGSENLLFGCLGRGFYDPSLVDDKGTWTRDRSGKELAVVAKFKRDETSNPDVIVIHEQLNVTPLKEATTGNGADGTVAGFESDTDIHYNVPLSVPMSLHDMTTFSARGFNGGGTDFTDLTLTKDSFAKQQPPG
jgi:hypothetical protein